MYCLMIGGRFRKSAVGTTGREGEEGEAVPPKFRQSAPRITLVIADLVGRTVRFAYLEGTSPKK